MNEEQQVEEYLQEELAKIAAQQGSFPEPPNKDTLLKFVRDIVEQEDPERLSRTANLKDEEVGKPRVSSLALFHIGQYAEAEGLTEVSAYLKQKAGALSSLSLGRRAKILETLFTVRRETKHFGTPKTTTNKTLFGSKTVKEGEE